MNPIDASIREEIQQLIKEPWSQSKPNKPYKLLKFVDTVAATAIFALQNVVGSASGRGVCLGGEVCIQVGSVSGESASGREGVCIWGGCWADPPPN